MSPAEASRRPPAPHLGDEERVGGDHGDPHPLRADDEVAEDGVGEDEVVEDQVVEDQDEVGERPSRGLPFLLVGASVLGLVAAMMLTIDRFRLLVDPDVELGCNVSPFIACGPVMSSRAGELFGFPNPLLGVIGFTLLLTTGFALLAGARFRPWYWRGLQVGVVLAAVFITWLQAQSLYVIAALCLWCLLVWTVTIPVVVAVTLHNLAAGHLGRRAVLFGRRLRPWTATLVAVWYLVVLSAIALRFYRDFALFWFGVVLP